MIRIDDGNAVAEDGCRNDCKHNVCGDGVLTAGGIPLEEVNFRTMESKLLPGLYLVGEQLDCDGRIGGFNFQWAWATGRVAGRAVAASLPARSDC